LTSQCKTDGTIQYEKNKIFYHEYLFNPKQEQIERQLVVSSNADLN